VLLSRRSLRGERKLPGEMNYKGLASKAWLVIVIGVLLALPEVFATRGRSAQKSKTPPPLPETLLKRTTTRRESQRLGYGGTVTIVGAPAGSITIEGWPRSEVEVVADIELNGANEDDLNRLAAVNSFLFDADSNHISIMTTGMHDKAFMRRSAKNFPKNLLNLPWKVDYRIRVPAVTDLEINGGRGAIKLSGVEGAIRLSSVEGETNLVLTGGVVSATVAAGNVVLHVPARSWRGSGADIRVAAGTLTLELLPGFSGDIDADILKAGRIEDNYGSLESRERPGLTQTVMRARAGVGGAFFKFTVGVGTVSIRKIEAGNN